MRLVLSQPECLLSADRTTAINKPSAISSAQVIRDVQDHFNPSKLFAPWLEREQHKRDVESHNQKKKRKWRGRRDTSVKMGHGGTLDPLATGVLILGLGSGTKELGHFTTECTKTYEAVLLFGVATDTYDTEGKIVGRKPYEHITREIVEEALSQFRGKGMQKPPIFSALRVQGKRLYEYAREGKELPVAIQERPVEVHELELTEWMEGGTHQWHWPDREAEIEEKKFAAKALDIGNETAVPPSKEAPETAGSKRKRDSEVEPEAPPEVQEPPAKQVKTEEVQANTKASSTSADAGATETTNTRASTEQITLNEQSDIQHGTIEASKTETVKPPCPAPACRIRMSVTSGFYVRSLCHDLGAAVDSLGIMAELVRTRQGDFKLRENVLEYDDLKLGEEVWGPKVKALLEGWREGKAGKVKAVD